MAVVTKWADDPTVAAPVDAASIAQQWQLTTNDYGVVESDWSDPVTLPRERPEGGVFSTVTHTVRERLADLADAIGGDNDGLVRQLLDAVGQSVEQSVTDLESSLGLDFDAMVAESAPIAALSFDISDILNNLVPDTLVTGHVAAVNPAGGIDVRLENGMTVTTVEWFIPIQPNVGDRVLVGRTRDNEWVIVSTFDVQPPRVSHTGDSLIVYAPSNPAIERWQARYRTGGGPWIEGDAVVVPGPGQYTFTSVASGTQEVQIRYDLVGDTGLGVWSQPTFVTLGGTGSTVVPPVAPTPTAESGFTVTANPIAHGAYDVSRPVITGVTFVNWQVRTKPTGHQWIEWVVQDASTEKQLITLIGGASAEVQVRVRLTAGAGWQDWSASEVIGVPGVTPPAAPTVTPRTAAFTIMAPAARTGGVRGNWWYRVRAPGATAWGVSAIQTPGADASVQWVSGTQVEVQVRERVTVTLTEWSPSTIVSVL